ncbi:MAG: 16S rRNA (cytosine(1402)-N(4))-methyltransferase RsmH [Mariniblastus sp.]|nr:16S rRNA (cytosine(1402)-N(4))-methyltransferase RsmH [Mariniblastus sp.]
MSKSVHLPVLLETILENLALAPGSTVLDGTMGGGGHSLAFCQQVGPQGRVFGFDRDPAAVRQTNDVLPENGLGIAGNYADIPEYLDQLEIRSVDAILLDLGLSSDQLADSERGFSFKSAGPLDLRFDSTAGEPAWRLINRLGEKHLADLIYEYGEERFSRRIARKICRLRHDQPIKTADQLAQIVRSCIPRRKRETIDPATRTFQALRIAVNEELKWLGVALKRLPDCLAIGGKFAIISFHSLEDRMVKNAFAEDRRLKVLTKRPLMADAAEVAGNPRSRSAKLRIAERVAVDSSLR